MKDLFTVHFSGGSKSNIDQPVCPVFSFRSIWALIKGILGAKKYPVKLANRMGIKCPKPVKVANNMVVLMGVRVTQALTAAIQLTTARVSLVEGNRWCMISPRVAPTKNRGMMN